MERKKRSIPLSALVEFDSLGESSEDSDFRIEDHIDESNEDISNEDISADSEEEQHKPDTSHETDINMKTSIEKENLHELILEKQGCKNIELSRILICCVCLGDKSNDDNEIVECDDCGVTVHEDCYGIPENESVSSSGSGNPKTSWFCEACQAGKQNLSCELCPNFGGVFKETDTGLWVHLVCALYIPGVAFRDVDHLNNVTLFEMSYSKWGKQVCSLCPDQKFAQTGVCIGCDAGLCRTYFHVTCAQKEGLLNEAQSEEINHADPFYAHCKLHSNKDITKVYKRNWLAFELQMAEFKKKSAAEGNSDAPKNLWLKERLQVSQKKYAESKIHRGQPWIPTQKMSRPLTSSASTVRALNRKATLSGIDTQALAMKEAHTNALADVHRKWHISPAFNVEYMGYYLDRNSRISTLKQNLEILIEENLKLTREQRELQVMYSEAIKDFQKEVDLNKQLKTKSKIVDEILSKVNSSKITKCIQMDNTFSKSNSTPFVTDKISQALDIDVDVQHDNNETNNISENLCQKCIACSMATDQHLLVKCDTCKLHYHLGCLDPPLTRMPKKTKVMGWQCSECDKGSSDSDMAAVDTDKPRQLRQCKGSWANFKLYLGLHLGSKSKKVKKRNSNVKQTTFDNNDISVKQTSSDKLVNKNRERKRCNRNFAGSYSQSSLSVKEKCLTSNIPSQENEEAPVISKEVLFVPNEMEKSNSTPTKETKPTTEENNTPESEIVCVTCKQIGTKANVVTCDECLKGFHFLCLDPPVKKSPKVRGYSWHCAECDPSDSDFDD